MMLKRINSFRWMLSLLAISAILFSSINTASAATPFDTNRFAKNAGKQVTTTFLVSDRNGRQSKSKSKGNRGASQRKKAPSSSRSPSQRKKAPSSSRSPSQRKKAPSSSRSPSQRKKAPSSNRSPSQRKKAPSSNRSPSQRKKAPSSNRSPSQRKKAPSSSRNSSHNNRRTTVPTRQAKNPKRTTNTNRQSRDANSRKISQRNLYSNRNKNSSRSPRVNKRVPDKPSASSRYSRYQRQSQKSSKNNTAELDRSQLTRTGKLYRNRSVSKSASKISVWRNSSSNEESNFKKRNKQLDRLADYNKVKNLHKPLQVRRSIFESPGAGEIYYDPPSSPIEKVIYDNQYNNYYYNDSYYNYNNYYDYGDYFGHGDRYDHGYGHFRWYGGHHNSHFYHSLHGHGFGFWFNFSFHSGYRHHYYYPHWSYVDYYYYEPFYPSHYYSTVYYEPVTQITYEPLLPSIDEGWELLANGAFEEALGVFAELVYALPEEASPRIGYSIASGMLYRNGAAISAMRRAIIDDPYALLDVPIEPLITEHYQWLLEHFSQRVREDSEDVDGLFIVAVMRFILEEPTQAYFAIDLAIRRGDEDQSAENLKALISDVIEQGF